MKELAADYYSHFFFGSREGRLHLTLSPHAPQPLRELVSRACGPNPSQEDLLRVFGCLCATAQHESCIVAQEPPTMEMLQTVHSALRGQLSA